MRCLCQQKRSGTCWTTRRMRFFYQCTGTDKRLWKMYVRFGSAKGGSSLTNFSKIYAWASSGTVCHAKTLLIILILLRRKMSMDPGPTSLKYLWLKGFRNMSHVSEPRIVFFAKPMRAFFNFCDARMRAITISTAKYSAKQVFGKNKSRNFRAHQRQHNWLHRCWG